MRQSSNLKAGGYVISALSVVLLAVPSIKSALDDRKMLPFVLIGSLLSIVGMWIRWRSHRASLEEE